MTLPTASTPHLVRTGPRGGTPVVLVHPVGLDLTYWSAQIEALCDDHDVLAFDLPGHGLTPGTPGDCTFEHGANVLEQVVRTASSGPAHVVGLSVGGMIAQQFAITRPGLVASLTLMDTAATFGEDTRTALRARAETARVGGMPALLASTLDRWFTPRTRARRPDLIDRVTRTLLADDAQVHAAMWDMISSLDFASRLHRIACPALVIVGEHDPSSPPAAARVLHDGIAGSRLHVIEAASHMAPLESPTEVNQLLVEFLRTRR